jgi:hypothetical protein
LDGGKIASSVYIPQLLPETPESKPGDRSARLFATSQLLIQGTNYEYYGRLDIGA